ncbi:uncharacterized protein [Procambarus clarkii]|uniref:uncharacterized protein n=1 Tax=Procambarus clarkii TaxID=6728 RepID=UPI003742F3E6
MRDSTLSNLNHLLTASQSSAAPRSLLTNTAWCSGEECGVVECSGVVYWSSVASQFEHSISNIRTRSLPAFEIQKQRVLAFDQFLSRPSVARMVGHVVCPLLLILGLLVLSSTPLIVGRKPPKQLPPDVYKIAGGHNANRPGVGALTSYTAEAADRSNRGPPVIFGSRFRPRPYWQNYYNPYFYDY